jgi:5-methylthioadenosine/S-adenosylhomocysteine deaminase
MEAGVYPAMIENLDDIEKAVRDLHSKYHNIENGRIKIALAPAAVWSNSGESLKLLKKLSDELDLIYSLHVSETPFDRDSVKNLHGKDEIDLLIELGLLNEKLIMVHCVYLTDYDISKIKEYGATVSHNPASNMYLSSGVAPIPRLNREGISVGLGLDGAASNNSNDMIELLKLTALLQKVHHRNPTIMTADKVLEMATIEGAKALMLEKEIGSLEIGKKADLFIFNPKRDLKAIPMHNPVSTLVYSSGNKNVETVMVDGDILMEDGVVTKIDESFVADNCQRLADELSIKAGTDKLKKRPWKRI